MPSQKPYKVFNDLVIHTIQTEIFQIEHNAQIIDDLLKTFFWGFFLKKINLMRPTWSCNSFCEVPGNRLWISWAHRCLYRWRCDILQVYKRQDVHACLCVLKLWLFLVPSAFWQPEFLALSLLLRTLDATCLFSRLPAKKSNIKG